jgi:hypothetical protein
MDHKGSVFFLISSLGVNELINGSDSPYPNNKNLTDINLITSHGSSQTLDKNSKQNQWV